MSEVRGDPKKLCFYSSHPEYILIFEDSNQSAKKESLQVHGF